MLVAFSLAYNLVPLMSLQVDKAVYNETLLFPLHKRNKSLVSLVTGTLYYTVLNVTIYVIRFYPPRVSGISIAPSVGQRCYHASRYIGGNNRSSVVLNRGILATIKHRYTQNRPLKDYCFINILKTMKMNTDIAETNVTYFQCTVYFVTGHNII